MADYEPHTRTDVHVWWWLPSQQDKAVSGRLILDPEEVPRMELYGILVEGQEEPGSHELLLGRDENGKEVSAIRARELARLNVHGHKMLRGTARWFLRGPHVDPGACKVQVLAVQWKGSEEWALQRHLRAEPGQHVPEEAIETVKLSSIGATVSVEPRSGISVNRRFRTWTRDLWWVVSFDSAIDIDKALDVMRVFRDFMWLVIGQCVGPREIKLTLQNDEDVVLLNPFFYQDRSLGSLVGPFLPMNLGSIRAPLGEVLERWVELRAMRKENAFSSWMMLIDKDRGPIEPLLAATVRFLDALAPKKYFLEETRFKEAIAPVIQALSQLEDELAGRLRNVVQNANTLGLRHRVKSLLETLPKDFCKKMGLDERFVERAIEVRNKLAHEGEGGVNVVEAVYLRAKCRILALACVFKQIGVQDDELFARFENVYQWHVPASVDLV